MEDWKVEGQGGQGRMRGEVWRCSEAGWQMEGERGKEDGSGSQRVTQEGRRCWSNPKHMKLHVCIIVLLRILLISQAIGAGD
jgi:hypothetical protein